MEGKLQKAIKKLEEISKSKGLNFLIVGSVAYKENKESCDDLDCIIIYNDIRKMENFPYISKELYNSSLEALSKKEIDLFATKFLLEEVPVSLDFISLEYLEKLSEGDFYPKAQTLKKMTDAQENPLNDYYSFYGQEFIYEKSVEKNRGFNIYILPKYIYHEGSFFSGVLHNKFIHNPKFMVVKDREVLGLQKKLIENYSKFYNLNYRTDKDADITKSIRRWKDFSKESREYIKRIFQTT